MTASAEKDSSVKMKSSVPRTACASVSETVHGLSRAAMLFEIAAIFQVPVSLLYFREQTSPEHMTDFITYFTMILWEMNGGWKGYRGTDGW